MARKREVSIDTPQDLDNLPQPQVVRNPLCSGFLCSSLSTLSLWIPFYFSNIPGPFWAILLIQYFPISVQTFLLPPTLLTTAHPLWLPIPLQPLHIQFHNLHPTRPLLPPSFSRAGLCHSSQYPCPARARDELWDLCPTLYPEGPKALPHLPRSPPRSWAQTTLKLESSPQEPTPSSAPLLCLWEVAGAEGIVWVPVLFSLAVLSQIEKCLGSFSSDPHNYLKEFKYLTQAYNLTWHDVYIILSFTLLPGEKEWVWQASQAHEMRYTGLMTLMSPRDDPNWGFQTGRPGGAALIMWLLALLCAFKRQVIKPSTLISSGK